MPKPRKALKSYVATRDNGWIHKNSRDPAPYILKSEANVFVKLSLTSRNHLNPEPNPPALKVVRVGIYLSICLSIYLAIRLCMHIRTYVGMHVSMYTSAAPGRPGAARSPNSGPTVLRTSHLHPGRTNDVM